MNADTKFLPVVIIELEILLNVLITKLSNNENLSFTCSIPLPIGSKFNLLVALFMSSSPFVAPSKRNADLSLSRVFIEVLTFDSNCWLSNRISTTLESIVLLIN